MEYANVYGFEMVHNDEIEKIMQREHAILVDLRDEESYQRGHIKYARNLPFSYIMKWKREIPERVSLILYCEHGNQSLLAARKLKERKGAVYTVIGGYEEYKKSVDGNFASRLMDKRD